LADVRNCIEAYQKQAEEILSNIEAMDALIADMRLETEHPAVCSNKGKVSPSDGTCWTFMPINAHYRVRLRKGRISYQLSLYRNAVHSWVFHTIALPPPHLATSPLAPVPACSAGFRLLILLLSFLHIVLPKFSLLYQ
jgi:hypothetical protein